MMLNEKKIYEAWKRRFSYPLSPLEGLASKSLQRIKKISSVSEAVVRKKIQRAKLVMIGDDASQIQQQKMIDRLRITGHSKILFITNRPKDQVGIFSKSTRTTFVLVNKKTVQAENIAIKNAVEKNIYLFDKIIVWTGHLRVSTQGFQKIFSMFDPFFISLQCNELRWRFPKNKGWVRVHDHFYANLESSPLVSVDFYRSMDENLKTNLVDSKKDFLAIQKVLAQLLHQKKYQKPKKIISVFDANGIHQLNRLTFQPHILRFMKERVMLGESAVMPEQKLVLLSTLNRSHVAEEAAHYLRLAHRKNVDFDKAGVVVEEALAFFASLLLFPSRPIPKVGKRKTQWDEVHMTGYYLGFRLWKIWSRSVKARRLINVLWKMYPTNRYDYGIMLSLMQDLK